MDIKEAIELIREFKKSAKQTEIDVLTNISKSITSSLEAISKDNREKAKFDLQDSFCNMLLALYLLDINVDQFLNDIKVQNNIDSERSMHIYSDRVEICVGDKIKGGWALWSTEDLIEAFNVAREFNCKVIMQDLPVSDEESSIEFNNA